MVLLWAFIFAMLTIYGIIHTYQNDCYEAAIFMMAFNIIMAARCVVYFIVLKKSISHPLPKNIIDKLVLCCDFALLPVLVWFIRHIAWLTEIFQPLTYDSNGDSRSSNTNNNRNENTFDNTNSKTNSKGDINTSNSVIVAINNCPLHFIILSTLQLLFALSLTLFLFIQSICTNTVKARSTTNHSQKHCS